MFIMNREFPWSSIPFWILFELTIGIFLRKEGGGASYLGTFILFTLFHNVYINITYILEFLIIHHFLLLVICFNYYNFLYNNFYSQRIIFEKFLL